jgi:hypothetical protein
MPAGRTPGWADGVTADRPARRAGAEAVSLVNAIHALPGESADSLRVASCGRLACTVAGR